MEDYLVKDIRLAPEGMAKIEWVSRFMPVLNIIKREFERDRPFEGLKIACCLHLEMKTAFLALVLRDAGAVVSIAGSNPLTTQDDVAAALANEGVHVYAWRGETEEEYYANLERALSIQPDIIIDDGGDLGVMLHTKRKDILEGVIGGAEETTSGVKRYKALEAEGMLSFPVIAVNDSKCKYLFDNRYGTGQSTIDGILRATNLLLAGKNIVIAGYGWVGRGLAMRISGMGGNVIVTEVNPIRALEARMDGFTVMPMSRAAEVGDIFITATGNINVIRREHFERMKDGVILANAGHFDVEISKRDLEEIATAKAEPRPNITEYRLSDGRRIYLLCQGRLVNLAAADGHPADIMDLSFSLQALAARYIAEKHGEMERRVYVLPEEIDRKVASYKLESMGISIDRLTEEQEEYLKSWR